MSRPWNYVAPAERGVNRPGDDVEVLELVRRGVDHGAIVLRQAPAAATPEPAAAWRNSEPALLPGLCREGLKGMDAAIAETLAMFDRLRDGGRFLDEIEQRLWDDEVFVYAGSTIDAVDQREIEKIFVDAPMGPGRYHARDLSAKLSWIADDEQDLSLRIRFSFGHEATRDWLTPSPRAEWSDRFAEHAFPECAILTTDSRLRTLLDEALDRPWRLSERIVFSNVPGGGAMFHHDADPGQRGVAFAQLAGTTVWLAAPTSELAGHVAAVTPEIGDVDAVLTAMKPEPSPALWEVLNANPALTGRLADADRLLVLHAGDALLLPSPDFDRCVWHSVFGVGDRPSLAHSYAVFDACTPDPT